MRHLVWAWHCWAPLGLHIWGRHADAGWPWRRSIVTAVQDTARLWWWAR